MNIPHAPDGIFEGGILFDGCDYRTGKSVVCFVYASGRLGFVKRKIGYFVAEFLTKHSSPQFSHPVWDECRSSVICESIEEAQKLIESFVNESNEDGA